MASDLVVTGDIVSDGEVQIDGEVVGDIRSSVLLVGASAKIKGEIFADTIRIHGNINGQIKAKTVHLAKTAHVVGDILHENLSVDEGAYIEGHITRMTDTASSISDERVNLVVNKTQSQQRPGQTPAQPSGADKKIATGV
ncbi:MAG: polymer-forming cytoskeletal protein [Rhodospirillaceae bacterium]|nr:polymer-forming cytoskeletal protein [Rhodospirillaceae bacterium]